MREFYAFWMLTDGTETLDEIMPRVFAAMMAARK